MFDSNQSQIKFDQSKKIINISSVGDRVINVKQDNSIDTSKQPDQMKLANSVDKIFELFIPKIKTITLKKVILKMKHFLHVFQNLFFTNIFIFKVKKYQ